MILAKEDFGKFFKEIIANLFEIVSSSERSFKGGCYFDPD